MKNEVNAPVAAQERPSGVVATEGQTAVNERVHHVKYKPVEEVGQTVAELSAEQISRFEAAADELMKGSAAQRAYGNKLIADADAVDQAIAEARSAKNHATYLRMFNTATARIRNLGLMEEHFIRTSIPSMAPAVVKQPGATVTTVELVEDVTKFAELEESGEIEVDVSEHAAPAELAAQVAGSVSEVTAAVPQEVAARLDESEVDFFNGKRQLIRFLDKKAFALNDRLTFEENNANRTPGVPWRKLGRSLVSLPGRVLRGIEGFFTPKAEMLRGMRSLKEETRSKLRKDLEKDLTIINSGIDAVTIYVNNNFRDIDLNGMGEEGLQAFVDECLYAKESPHYAPVMEIMKLQAQDRVHKYNVELARVEGVEQSSSYDENINELLAGSRYLRAKEKILGAPRAAYNAIRDAIRGKKAEPKAERMAWFDEKIGLPVLEMVVTYGAMQGAKLHQADAIPDTDKETQLTDIGRLKAKANEEKWENRKRKLGWAAAMVAALGLTGLAGFGVYEKAKGKKAVAVLADAPKAKKASPNPVASGETVASADQAPEAQPQKAVDPADYGKAKAAEGELGKSIDKGGKDKGAAHAHTSAPKAKIAVIGPKFEPKQPEKEAEKPEVKQDTPETVDQDIVALSDAERDAALRTAETNIAGYRTHLDVTFYSGVKLNKADEDKLIGSIDQLTKELRELRTKGDLKKVQASYAEIEGQIAALDGHIKGASTTETYVGAAEQNSRLGLQRLEEIKKLAKGNVFEIKYVVHKGEGKDKTDNVVSYPINLDTIYTNLNRIATETATGNSSKLNLVQAQLDAADAKYWRGYLDFVEWNLKWNPQAVVYAQ